MYVYLRKLAVCVGGGLIGLELLPLAMSAFLLTRPKIYTSHDYLLVTGAEAADWVLPFLFTGLLIGILTGLLLDKKDFSSVTYYIPLPNYLTMFGISLEYGQA